MSEKIATLPMPESVDEDQPASILPNVAADLCAKRKEAVNGRKASGIEGRWAYAEAAYNGKDENVEGSGGVLKPSAPSAPFINSAKAPGGWKRSTAFVNITRPYVDASSARVSDMLFPTDDRNFEIEPSPKLEIEDALKELNEIPEEMQEQFIAMVELKMDLAKASVMEAQKQIDDWLTESEWSTEGRNIILDAARMGTGVVKGPIPLLIDGEIRPGARRVQAQNCFPDPSCGEDIHNGEYFFELEEVVARKLRAKIGEEKAGWISASIKACLKEGAKSYLGGDVKDANGKRPYELWHMQGEVPREVLLECNCTPSDDSPRVWANVTLCNDYIVRVSEMPQQQRFSYDVLNWQKRNGHWAGVGIGEQLETIQRGLNAGMRNLFDNAALSALPQIIHWRGVIEPVDGQYEVSPGKSWVVLKDDEITINDVKNAIMTIEIPSRQGELMEIIALMRSMAQEVTGFPMILQGQGSTGQVGSDQLQSNAASTVLRRLAKNFDEQITIPQINAFYQWYRDDSDNVAPEAYVKARGSSVLVERDIQAQALIQMVQLSKDPTYEMDPKLVAEEWMRSQKFDPKKVKLSPERKQELMQLVSQPDEKAQAQVKSAEMRMTALERQTATEAETDRIELQLKQEDAERSRQHDKVMLDLQYKYKLMEYALQKNIDLGTAQEQLQGINTPETSTSGTSAGE